MNNPAGSGHPAFKHGKSRDRIYQLWQNMHQRCYKLNNPEYKRYGARGIKVCQRWHSFELFYADVGDPPTSMSFDRIDNNGNYKPSNWRWATSSQQAQNRRNNILLTYNGRTMSLNYWKKALKLDSSTIIKRLKLGLPIEKVLTKGPLNGVSIEQREELKQLAELGYSYSKIAQKIGLSKSTVFRWVRSIKKEG